MNEVIGLTNNVGDDRNVGDSNAAVSITGQFATAPTSSTPDQIMEMHRRLSFLRQTRDIRSVLVTSTVPRQGKTTVALALAAALAKPLPKAIRSKAVQIKEPSRVLIVDGDLRNAGVARMVGQSALLPGLAEGLEHDRELLPLVRPMRNLNIQWLPAGCPSKRDPSSLLGEHAMKGRLHELSMQFDWMVLDAPSVQSDECNLLAVAADVVVMVVRPEYISNQHLREGISKLDPSFLAGVIFNHEEKARPQKWAYGFFPIPAFSEA
jgi:Mrp family chromosome partitioning ATPase